MGQVAIAPDIFTWPAEAPQLIGATCTDCRATTFPKQVQCPRCSSMAMEERLLPRQGTLVTWTTQEFLPKEPYTGAETEADFVPFGVGLVQLDDVVRVESRLTVGQADRLHFGMPVEMVVIPFRVDDDGNEVVTFAFAPV
jgi:uncharacterized OB-fold protein